MPTRKLTPEEVEAKLGSGLVIFGGRRPSTSAASSATAASSPASLPNPMQEAEDANLAWFKQNGMKPLGTARPEPTPSAPPAGTSAESDAAP